MKVFKDILNQTASEDLDGCRVEESWRICYKKLIFDLDVFDLWMS